MITSLRNEFIGGHTTKPVKEALKAEAQKQGLSVSAFLELAVVHKLRTCGYELELRIVR